MIESTFNPDPGLVVIVRHVSCVILFPNLIHPLTISLSFFRCPEKVTITVLEESSDRSRLLF